MNKFILVIDTPGFNGKFKKKNTSAKFYIAKKQTYY